MAFNCAAGIGKTLVNVVVGLSRMLGEKRPVQHFPQTISGCFRIERRQLMQWWSDYLDSRLAELDRAGS